MLRDGLRQRAGDQILRDHHQRARAAARRRPEGHRQPVLTGQAPHDREAEPGAGQAREVRRGRGDRVPGAAQRDLAHDQAAVLHRDDESGRHLLDVDMDLGGRRREVRGVVQEFGERVHHALRRVPGDGGLAGGVRTHPLVAADTAHRAAQDRLHLDRLGPPAPRTGPGQHGDAVREPSGLRGAVVQVQQVAQDVGVGVPVLHRAQVGQHAGGQRLHPPGGVRARGHGGCPARLAAAQLPGDGGQGAPVGPGQAARRRGERGAGGVARLQPLDQEGQCVVGEPVGVGLQGGDPVT